MKWIVRHAAWLIPRFRGGGVWRSSSCTSSRGWNGIWKFRTEVGRWKSGVWLGKSDLTDEHLVRTDDGVVYARSVRRLAEHSWSEENLRSVTETPQKPRSTTTDDAADPRAVPEVHEHVNQDEEANDNDGEDEESPQGRRRGS